MSAPEVPTVAKLFEQKRRCVEDALLGCSTSGFDDPRDELRFYKWAQFIVNALVARNRPCPRLALARALGLLDEKRWSPDLELSVERSAPRHRVIARFAREGRWGALWSLNWDCWLESGLRSVGLTKGDAGGFVPWPTSYLSCVTLKEVLPAARDKVVSIYKPHGCVATLLKAQQAMTDGDEKRALALSDGFVITLDDIQKIKPTDPSRQVLFHKLGNDLVNNPLVAAGWSVSERYLIELFQKLVKPVKHAGLLAQDELTIVDLEFQNGHKDLANCYNLSDSVCFARVFKKGFDADSLFLWVQALYALYHLDKHADQSVKPRLKTFANSLQQPAPNHFVLKWADSFLSSWVRLCWRSELVTYHLDGRPIPSHAISMESRDEHIPWNIEGTARPDLAAAATILSTIGDSGRDWNFSKFPGGFWREDDLSLIIPLPAWGGGQWLSDLRSLKPWTDSVGQDMSSIISIRILPVTIAPGQRVSERMTMRLKRGLAKELPHSHFAQVRNIGLVNPTELERKVRS